MLEISFIYTLQALFSEKPILLAVWVTAGLLTAVLTLGLKSLWSIRKWREGKHLLELMDDRRAFNIIGIALLCVSTLWNARHLDNIYMVAAEVADVLLCAYLFRHKMRNTSSSIMTGVLATSCAVVLAISPVVLSPVILLICAYCSFNSIGWEKTFISLVVIPAGLFLTGYLARNPQQLNGWIEVMIIALIVVLLVTVFALRNSLKRTRELLEQKDKASDLDHRRMDDLEIGIIKAERENLLNMLDIRRKEVKDTAEKMTDQSLFMQEIYDDVCRACEADAEDKDILLHELKSSIKLRMNFAEERNDFNTRVEMLHKDFSVRLQARFPGLSPQEVKLATMLRLEFPTKYIATILNISPKSVEIERHRLRKKMDLDRRVKLTDFMKTI